MAMMIETPQRFTTLEQAWRWCFETRERLNMLLDERTSQRDEEVAALRSQVQALSERVTALQGAARKTQ